MKFRYVFPPPTDYPLFHVPTVSPYVRSMRISLVFFTCFLNVEEKRDFRSLFSDHQTDTMSACPTAQFCFCNIFIVQCNHHLHCCCSCTLSFVSVFSLSFLAWIWIWKDSRTPVKDQQFCLLVLYISNIVWAKFQMVNLILEDGS